jgi:hypothetical protein
MTFKHWKKIGVASMFACGILSGSAMASYVSDGMVPALSDVSLDLSDPAGFPRFRNSDNVADSRTLSRMPGLISGAQRFGRNHGLAARKPNLRGGIRADGGASQVAGRMALPFLISDRSRLIKWETFNLDGSGKVNFSNGGDISLRAPIGGSGNATISVGGDISLRAPIAGSNAIVSDRGDLSLSQPGNGGSGSVHLIGGSISLLEPGQPSGIITIMGSNGYSNAISIPQSAPVPLPAAGILLGSGLLGLLSLGAGRRRR